MNVIEKGMWLRKFPKDAKSDVKILLNRVNFHEIKDMGNEDYVINIINESNVVDKKDCEGELHLMCASSRFEMKSMRYLMRFGEKNEMILLKEDNMYLTEAEDLALDRYMASFTTTIKIELDYPVLYSVKIVEAPVKQVQPIQPVQPVQQVQPQLNVVREELVQNNYAAMNVQAVETKNVVESNTFDLDSIYRAVSVKEGNKVSLTAFCRDGLFGVNVDIDGQDAACIEVAKNTNLEVIDQIRAIATAISMTQALGSYLRLRNNDYEIKFYYYQDIELSIQQLPENFIDLSGAIAIAAKTN